MNPVLVAAGLAITLLASATSSAATLYVANENAGSLTIIAHGVSIAGDGSRAYVSNAFEDSVSVVDLGSHAELARFPTAAGPNGIVAR